MKNLDASGSEVNEEAAVQLVDSDSENGDDDKGTSTKNYQIFMKITIIISIYQRIKN